MLPYSSCSSGSLYSHASFHRIREWGRLRHQPRRLTSPELPCPGFTVRLKFGDAPQFHNSVPKMETRLSRTRLSEASIPVNFTNPGTPRARLTYAACGRTRQPGETVLGPGDRPKLTKEWKV